MAVRIRMKRMGRKHRSFFRICATDSRSPRDGRVIEEIGTYDPHVADTDARTTINGVEYAMFVAQPGAYTATYGTPPAGTAVLSTSAVATSSTAVTVTADTTPAAETAAMASIFALILSPEFKGSLSR